MVVKWATIHKNTIQNTIVQAGENEGTDESFGCFSSHILADRDHVRDFHVSKRQTADTMLVKSRVI